jgi:hypothetical protein
MTGFAERLGAFRLERVVAPEAHKSPHTIVTFTRRRPKLKRALL